MRPLAPLAVVAFVTGAAVLAVELVVPRALAPYVGVSLPVWTATIAVVLAGLAAGNALGGAWVDRSRGRAPDGVALLAAALAWAVAPALDRAVAPLVEGAPLLPRALVRIAASVLPAFVALGAVPTLLARAAVAADPARAGRALGAVSAAGALGSLAGVYATGFALLPSVGLAAISRAICALLAATGLARLALARRAPAAASASPAPAPIAPAAGLSPARAATLAFAAGAALLVVEVTAARGAARLVGGGVDTWTAVLGAVLAGLAAGGVHGGRRADRVEPRAAVARLLLLASAAVALSAWTPLLLSAAARAVAFPWTLRLAVGSLLAWGVPAFALGALSPALARAALPAAGGSGRAIGLVFAAGTAGAVAGALATSPVLCPLLGTRPTLIALALALVLLRPLAGARVETPFAVALALLLAAGTAPFSAARAAGAALRLREGEGTYVRESGYAYLRVAPLGGEREGIADRARDARVLTIDGFVHGFVDLADPAWLGYGYEGIYAAVTDRVATERPLRAFFVGGGAYVFPRHLRRTRPDAVVEVAEIDPAVTRAAREALGLAAEPGFRILHEDARTAVGAWAPGSRWDLVYGDAFNDLSVPWHLATLEFARRVHDGLAEGGVYLLNVVDDAGAPRFVGAVVATLRRVFRRVDVLGVDRGGDGRETFVVVAADRVLDLDGLLRPDPSGERAAGIPVVRYGAAEVDAFVAGADGLVLTDDHAPVEWLLAPVARARTGVR